MTMLKRMRGLGAAGLVALTVVGCDDGLADLNVNPNDPVAVDAIYLFPNATEAAVTRVIGGRSEAGGVNLDLAALWVQHWAEHEYAIEDRYEIGDSRIASYWSGFYSGPLQDFAEVIAQGREQDRPHLTAMGLVMKAWTAQVVTDLWGDVGYTQALNVRDPDAPLTVAYDPQEQVYQALLDETAEAAQLAADPDGDVIDVGDADLIYGGDAEQWRKFANSLRMRMAMRLSGVAAGVAQSEFADAYAAGGFEANDDNAILWYPGQESWERHPIYAYMLGRDDHSVSGTMIDTLQSFNDPRLPVYARPNASGNFWGAPNGDRDLPHLDSISRIGTFYSSADSPGILMSYAELLLLQAEAAERGWITATAADLYTAAIRASMEFNGVVEADITAYLAQPRVVYQGGPAGLEQIALQKWLVLFGNGAEAYAEWRRTGVPVLTPGPDALNDGVIPVRLFYPSIEESLNRAALEEATARQGGATLNDPLWWDVD